MRYWDWRKIYCWINVVVNPLGLVLLLTNVIPVQYSWTFLAWVIVSSLFNQTLRDVFGKLLTALIIRSMFVSCSFTLIGTVIAVVLALLFGTIGLTISLLYLFISSLVTIIKEW